MNVYHSLSRTSIFLVVAATTARYEINNCFHECFTASTKPFLLDITDSLVDFKHFYASSKTSMKDPVTESNYFSALASRVINCQVRVFTNRTEKLFSLQFNDCNTIQEIVNFVT